MTLTEIINAVRDGQRPDYEDLRYAICAMESLTTFDRMAFMKLAEAEREGKKPFMVTSAQWQWEEHFNRHKRAGDMQHMPPNRAGRRPTGTHGPACQGREVRV